MVDIVLQSVSGSIDDDLSIKAITIKGVISTGRDIELIAKGNCSPPTG